MAGPLIVTAELGRADFAWLDGLRCMHYPAERNRVPAHLTLFRSLPPSAEAEVRRTMALACSRHAPRATLNGLMDLGGGVAVKIRSEELDQLRADMVEAFHGLLTPQDAGGWIPHVTVQNKARRGAVRELVRTLEMTLEPRPIVILGLLLFRYDDGRWEPLGGCRFRAS